MNRVRVMLSFRNVRKYSLNFKHFLVFPLQYVLGPFPLCLGIDWENITAFSLGTGGPEDGPPDSPGGSGWWD